MILDIILLLPIFYGLIRGVFRGLVGELTAIVAVVAGVVCAKIFAPKAAVYLTTIVTWNSTICELIAYSAIFLIVTFALHLIGKLLSKLLKTISLGWLNRLLGAVFGAAKWAIIVSVLLNCFNMLDERFNILQPEVKKDSVAYVHLQKVAGVTWEAIQNSSND